MCAQGRAGENAGGRHSERAARETGPRMPPDWALPAGPLKGLFLLIGAASAWTPPSPTPF